VASQLFHTRHSEPDGTAHCRGLLHSSRGAVRSLFDFGEERVETLAPGVFVFGQSDLKQTPEAKFAAHAKRAPTVRALVRLVTGKGISEAIEIHLREGKSGGLRPDRQLRWYLRQRSLSALRSLIIARRSVRQKRFLQRRSTDFTGTDQHRRITTAKKAGCEVECFAVHKHFYGD
jgi:hypothetical protein